MLHTFPPIYNDPLGNFCIVEGFPWKRLHQVPHKLSVVLSVPFSNGFLNSLQIDLLSLYVNQLISSNVTME